MRCTLMEFMLNKWAMRRYMVVDVADFLKKKKLSFEEHSLIK